MMVKTRIDNPTGNPFPALKEPRPVIDAEGVVRYTWDDPKQPGHDAWEREHRRLAKANPSKYPALSKVIRDKNSYVNSQMRIARFLDKAPDGQSVSAEIAFERMMERGPDGKLTDDGRWWDRHRRAMRIPDARAVDEKGETGEEAMGRTLYDLLQAARKRETRVSVEGETRELPAGEPRNDPSAQR